MNDFPQTSQDRLMHAALSEDARLPDSAPDQDLLDSILDQIDTPPSAAAPNRRRMVILATSMAAACVIGMLGLGGLFTQDASSPYREAEQPFVSYQAPPVAVSEAPLVGKQKRQSPVPPAASAPIADVITTTAPTAISIPGTQAVTTVEAPNFGSTDDFAMGFGVGSNVKLTETISRSEVSLPPSTARYNTLIDPGFLSPLTSPLSTFSVDTDRASYTQLRSAINHGRPIAPDSVRIEEIVNAFDYAYPTPTGEHPFSVQVETASCPWNAENRLVKIGLQGRKVETRPATNLVLLCDVSGSMEASNKLGYLRASFMELIENLDERDTVSIVTYAGAEGIALPPTQVTSENRASIFTAIETLSSGGGTNGEAGIRLAYKLANKHFLPEGVNRVILATDGDFNVGATSDADLLKIVKNSAGKGTFLTVLGFGHNNLNDGMLEQITNDGNGQYFFIDSQQEGHRVFGQELTGTLVPIAKDVKIQVEFNPAQVAEYRLIGYANRQLQDEDFNNDRIDAGEIGSGHTVTALYEIVPGPAKPSIDPLKYAPRTEDAPAQGRDHTDLLNVKLRYKQPDGTQSQLLQHAVTCLLYTSPSPRDS